MLRRMAARPTWVFWTRGTLVSAICGHWLANSVLDPDQYSRAGLEYTWRASLPLVAQTVLVLVAIVMVGAAPAHQRPKEHRRRPRFSTSRLLSLVATSQLLLFLLLEVSERVYQREPFTEGLFGQVFALELLIALISSLLLTGLGSIARRVIRSLFSRPTGVPITDRIGPITRRIAPTLALIVVGDVRAPPPVPA